VRSFSKYWAVAALAVSACGGSDKPTHTVGGTLSGLSGTVVLTNSGVDDLTLTQDGSFTFATAVAEGATYDVAVKTQPSGQTCTVASGSGTVGTANVTNVEVTCTDMPAITSFAFQAADNAVLSADAVGVIGASHIAVAVPNGKALTSLTPTITTSSGATVDPASGVAQDFSASGVGAASPVVYTASAGGVTKPYSIVVDNSKKNILLFTIDGIDATLATGGGSGGGSGAGTVTLELPCGTALTSLTPTIALSDKATVSPASGEAQDFSNSETTPVTYTVTAPGDSNPKSWAAKVTAPCP
jgi:hypothetical protein